ncbi:endolytic transglycosylase MltG [Streptomyces sp. LP05-1]|uniref:Endolytic murein transglycosylase n=1 Tax=Streptomyces pyxinae TaxID=2970734 RepID=A0ABT2CQY5_9ACTN|nr:endolytic transglycosylase MltG [Streptomyces sp. LP05-1]MCS0639720.1 endolytic transglycosylase MltG [Streptomyces sp. LP05-1]
MTGYGRSSGSEPWHPEDPLYGDLGWAGQQTGGQQQYYQPQQQVQYGGQGQDPYAPQAQPYTDPHHQAPGNYHGTGGQQYDGGWDTGQQTGLPYGAPPAAPGSYRDSYQEQSPDLYPTAGAYPPPEPPARRQPEAPVQEAGAPRAPRPLDELPDEPDDDHPFFSDGRYGDAAEDADEPDEHALAGDPGSGRRGRSGKSGRAGKGKKGRKGRNGLACLVVATVLAGGAGGVAYFGYQFWQKQFGAAPDFTGDGTNEVVEVEIPKGAGGYEIAAVLVKNGVVKSQGAFVSAQEKNPRGKNIQDGAYRLRKGMSAASAVEAMLNPANRNSLIIPEGSRNAQIYKRIDEQLELDAGTTAKVAKSQAAGLGLPAWALNHTNVKDPLEGFLFPASYPVAKGAKPEAVLKRMVARANAEYGKLDLEAKARAQGLKSPWELLTVASLVQAEGKTDDDFRKMGEVVYNRLKPTNTETNQLLQFDSAYNYLQGQSEIEISEAEINSNKDPYNTYTQRGLTPGPISNPGAEALSAAMNPTQEGWMYFVATDGKHQTEFAKNHAEFLKLKEKFNDNQGSD